jgi:hypothetical protein
MNSLIQFKGTASFSRFEDCENAERFIFKAVCGPVFAVSARSRGATTGEGRENYRFTLEPAVWFEPTTALSTSLYTDDIF